LAQDSAKILPQFLNLDSAYEKLAPNEAPLIKGVEWGINGNPDLGIGADNPTGEGQNTLVLTPTRSNIIIPDTELPTGFNKNVGSFESTVTQELYYMNYNGNEDHGIYVFNGNTDTWQKVIVDSELNFSAEPEAFMAEHRCLLRVKKDESGNIVEKYLLITDGVTWHKWIDVIAAIGSDGFNASTYSYWALQPPHFDRRELLEWAVRSPMVAPVGVALNNTADDAGKPNRVIGFAFQFCSQDVFTDGRNTMVSPFSPPVIVKATDYLSSPDLISKNIKLTITAGSPKCEYKNIYVRKTLRKSQSDIAESWGDWYLYDTIYKYTDYGQNARSVIGNEYWKRQGQWAAYSYDNVFNNITYIFDNSKLGQIVEQELFQNIGNDMPQLSVAISDLSDAALLGNNRSGYYNFDTGITRKISAAVVEDTVTACVAPLRTIKLYVYAARERGNFRIEYKFGNNGLRAGSFAKNVWLSQVGYIVGDDTQMRFGGQYYQQKSHDENDGNSIFLSDAESKEFGLDFAGKNGFRCYLKGTQYFADCEWYVSSQDYRLTKIDGVINNAEASDIAFLTNTTENYGFFVGMFTFTVPAGRYIACLGRHNVASDADYRGTSTYVMGIANSRGASVVSYTLASEANSRPYVNTVKPDALVTNSKEIEIDCTASDVDMWGLKDINNNYVGDLFYVLTPFNGAGSKKNRRDDNDWKFIEGYLQESEDNRLAVEKFGYFLYYEPDSFYGTQYNGTFTDKNGFFFGYSWGRDDRNRKLDVRFLNTISCATETFDIDVLEGASWFKDIVVSLVTYFSIGVANRITITDRITDVTGTIPYSNIAVSIKDGNTVYTDGDGRFNLVIHNGSSVPRVSNVYVNASGNFSLFVNRCGYVPVFGYSQVGYPCPTYQEIVIPNFLSNLRVVLQDVEYTSLKSSSSLINGIVGADLAGRVTFINKYATPQVESFLQRDSGGNTNPTHLTWTIAGDLNLDADVRTEDIKWVAFFTTKAINYKRYLQWVSDSIEFIDANGNATTDTAAATLVKLTITSLLNTNIANNLSLLTKYQFVQDDRLRVYDNGDGVLLDTATYGDIIDVQIQGTNYNQSAVNAKLIPPSENTVLSSTDSAGDSPITLYVRYDKRFDVLQDKTAFWIELYTPSQNTERLPFEQIESFYPVINGEIAIYTGGGVTAPVYTYPKTGRLNYWDTYLIKRNIIGIGKFIAHTFESPNITDTWGANITSGGKQNAINPNAAQIWYLDSTIKSDDYVSERNINGLSMFRTKNIKDFKGYKRGGIVGIICQFSTVYFICENDWFTTDFNYNYIYANAQGVQVANLDNSLSVPHQKIGQNFGCRLEDTGTIISLSEYVWWIDSKNQGAILSDYREAMDVSDITDKEGRKLGIKSYLTEKIKSIDSWNNDNETSKRFDIVCGVDIVRNNIHVSIRPRRDNSLSLSSFVNHRRNIDLRHQESFVYNLDNSRWTRFNNFTPEAYGKLRGSLGTEFFAFAGGEPYRQNKGNSSFLKFFGQQTDPVIIGVINKGEEMVNILQSLSMDLNNAKFYIDLIYGTQNYGYSYVPANNFKEKEKMYYAAFLRDMVSYLQNPIQGDYRSTLIDGKRLFSEYFIIRFVQEYATLGEYFEINSIDTLLTTSAPTKP